MTKINSDQFDQFDSEIPNTAALVNLVICLSSQIFGKKPFIFR